MDAKQWATMTPAQKEAARDNSGLSPQLIGLEGWRVEATVQTENDFETYRFIVGKSTGWKPCHLEIKTRRSLGGDPARKFYDAIRKIEFVR